MPGSARKIAASRQKPRRGSSPGTVDDFSLNDSNAYMMRELLQLELKLLKERLRPFGLALGSLMYLRALWERDAVTQRELGRRIGVNDASSRVALGVMESQGLVRRRRSASDMRKIRVYLTPKGKDLRKDLLPIAREVHDILMQGFSGSEAQMFTVFLQRGRKNLEAAVRMMKSRKMRA